MEPPQKKPRGSHHCSLCDEWFTEKRALLRHSRQAARHLALLSTVDVQRYACGECSKTFARPHDLRRHRAEVHAGRRRADATAATPVPELVPARRFKSESWDAQEPPSFASQHPAASDPLTTNTVQSNSPMLDTPDTGSDLTQASEKDSAEETTCMISHLDLQTIRHAMPACSGVWSLLEAALRAQLVNPSSEGRLEPSDEQSTSYKTSLQASPEYHDGRRLSCDAVLTPSGGSSTSIPSQELQSEPMDMSDDTTESLDSWLCSALESLYLSDTLAAKVKAGASTGGKPLVVQRCPVCRQQYLDPTELINCVLQHDDAPRPYSCKKCGFGFVKQEDLEKHERDATNVNRCDSTVDHVEASPEDEQPAPRMERRASKELSYRLRLHLSAEKFALKLRRSRKGDVERWSLSDVRRCRSFESLPISLFSNWTMPSDAALAAVVKDKRSSISIERQADVRQAPYIGFGMC